MTSRQKVDVADSKLGSLIYIYIPIIVFITMYILLFDVTAKYISAKSNLKIPNLKNHLNSQFV